MLMDNPFNPLPPLPLIRPRVRVKKLDIFELPTTNVSLSATSVDFGIDKCLYNLLPCECYITLQVNQAVPAGGAALPVNVVTPTSNSSTNTGTPASSSGEGKTPVVDHNSNNVIGSDITDSREIFAFLNKREGLIRFVNFVTGATPAPNA